IGGQVVHRPGQRSVQDLAPLALVGLVDLPSPDADVSPGEERIASAPIDDGQRDDGLPDLMHTSLALDRVETEHLDGRRQHDVGPVRHEDVAVLAHLHAPGLSYDVDYGAARDDTHPV